MKSEEVDGIRQVIIYIGLLLTYWYIIDLISLKVKRYIKSNKT